MAVSFLPIAAGLGGLGVAALLGYLLMKKSATPKVPAPTAPPAATVPTVAAVKNAAANKALGTEYASGKAAGFAQGGVDSTSGAGENLNLEEDPAAIAASKATADPAAFLNGYKDGYGAGFAAAETAKKIGTYASSIPDEAPPPPPALPAIPPGRPKSYVADPSGTGYNTGYGGGLTYGKNNSTDYAPGGSGANGVKSSDSAAVSKTYDDAQMTLWSSNWDLGYQYGWDTGQAKYHAASATTEYSTDSSDEGTTDSSDEGTTRASGVSYDGEGDADDGEVCVAEACDACGIARVGGWGPRTGAVLMAPRFAARKKFGGTSTKSTAQRGTSLSRSYLS